LPGQSSAFGELKRSAHDHCLEAIKCLVGIVRSNTVTIGDQLGWPFAWSLWTASRYLTTCEYYNTPYASEDLITLTNGVRVMGKQWQIASKYWILLDRAMKDLKQTRNSEQPSSKVLRNMVDLSISTSDLEDRFRVDPVLHSVDHVYERPSSSDTAAAHFVQPNGQVDMNEISTTDNTYATTMYRVPDNWYDIPLYASSAYQQSNSTTFSNTTYQYSLFG
jgi:hypothetical protein